MGGLEQIKCTVNISGSDGDRLQISTDLGSNPAAAARWLGDLRQAAWALQLRGALSGKGATNDFSLARPGGGAEGLDDDEGLHSTGHWVSGHTGASLHLIIFTKPLQSHAH